MNVTIVHTVGSRTTPFSLSICTSRKGHLVKSNFKRSPSTAQHAKE